MADKNYGNNSQLAELMKYISDEMKFPLMGAGGGFAPIATISAVMGTTAPAGWLACNGGTHNITDYPELAAYFASHFGRSNYFGGNGTTTFAVPDLRGEFLRGSGTNSHSGQGSGAAVGAHQDATEIPYTKLYAEANVLQLRKTVSNADVIKTETNHYYNFVKTNDGTDSGESYYTSRPTNTSVLFIIKATVAGDPNGHVYSTDEQIVGTWVDGKTIYEKTVDCGYLLNANTKAIAHGISNIDKVISIKGIIQNGAGISAPLPYPPTGTVQTISESITLVCNTTNIVIGTSENRSTFYAYVTMCYTKTS